MQEKDRQRIFNVLLGHIKKSRMNAEAYKVLEDFVAEDLRAIEPIVDDIVKRALEAQAKRIAREIFRLPRGDSGGNHHAA